MENVLQQVSQAPDESDLVRRFRSGDREAFERIVAEHRRPVYRMARRLLPTHDDADEAAQRAFVRAWQARTGFRGEASLRTWLVRIVTNVARSMRTRESTPDALGEPEHCGSDRAGPDRRLLLMETRRRVRRAVASLPPRQREVVRLKVFSELTHREVADLLAISEGAVKAHLHQAIGNLRRIMAGDGRE